nr:MAG TPA: hypothetical protein [Caudoviricetes sp.]
MYSIFRTSKRKKSIKKEGLNNPLKQGLCFLSGTKPAKQTAHFCN